MIVAISALRKVYPGKPEDVVAVAGIDLAVREGEVFGLLGPNGAGKTTTISICTTRARPTSGSVRIAGIDVVAQPSEARASMGVVPQYNTLDRALTIFENLYFHCRYFGMTNRDARARAQALLDQFHLGERGKAFPNQLSGGLQQRVQIARAIAHYPKVLFLDEPSAGLDPQSRIAMWDSIGALRKEGITVVLTTHYMEEADTLCDRVAVIDGGRVLALDTPEALKHAHGAHTVVDAGTHRGRFLGRAHRGGRPLVCAGPRWAAPTGDRRRAGSRPPRPEPIRAQPPNRFSSTDRKGAP